MVRKAQKSNKQFLLGVASLAFGVLCVVFIFITLCYDKMQSLEQERKFSDTYQIELTKGFVGDSVILCINDSMLWQGVVTVDSFALPVTRFAEQNMLMVDLPLQNITSSFNIENSGSRLILHKQHGTISLTTLMW